MYNRAILPSTFNTYFMSFNRFNSRLQYLLKNFPEIYQRIVQIEKYATYWETYQKLSPDFLGNLKKSVIISSTGSSTRIEGSTLSDEEIEAMISRSNIRNLSTRDEQEVSGYLELIKLVFASYETIPFNEGTILQFHEMSLRYSDKDKLHKGQYKTDSNKVILVEDGVQKGVIFDPTPPHLVQGEMIGLIEWTRSALKENHYNALLVIGNFIFEYLCIHPFKDGNGRTSQILTNLLLLQQGYSFTPYVSHEKIIEENKVDYYLSLRKSAKNWKTDADDNISAWMLFFLQIIEQQGKRAKEITASEDLEKYLSKQQTLIWKCFLEHSEWSRKEIAEKTNISINSINQSLNKLIEMHKIERIGKGRGTRYRKR